MVSEVIHVKVNLPCAAAAFQFIQFRFNLCDFHIKWLRWLFRQTCFYHISKETEVSSTDLFVHKTEERWIVHDKVTSQCLQCSPVGWCQRKDNSVQKAADDEVEKSPESLLGRNLDCSPPQSSQARNLSVTTWLLETTSSSGWRQNTILIVMR